MHHKVLEKKQKLCLKLKLSRIFTFGFKPSLKADVALKPKIETKVVVSNQT